MRALANLIAAALVLSQAAAEQSPLIRLVAAGTMLWIGLVGFALYLIREE